MADQKVTLWVSQGTWVARDNHGGTKGTGPSALEAAMDLANKLANKVEYLNRFIEGRATASPDRPTIPSRRRL